MFLIGSLRTGISNLVLFLSAFLFIPSAVFPQEGIVVINEIMYAPLRKEQRRDIGRFCQESYYYEEGEAEELEYVELFNRRASSTNISFWAFADGISFQFPAGITMQPSSYLVIASSTAGLRAKYGLTNNVLGNFAGRLSNKGERITLLDAAGRIVDSVRYNDRPPWPVGPDKFGMSLECINSAASNDTPRNWRSTGGGTPGVVNLQHSSHLPPLIQDLFHSPVKPRSTDSVTITARIISEAPLSSVLLTWSLLNGTSGTVPMFDDGNHGDNTIGDGVFGATLDPRPSQTVIRYRVTAVDPLGMTTTYPYDTDPSPYRSYFSYNGEYEGGPAEPYFLYVSQENLAYLDAHRTEKVDVDATFVHDWVVYDHVGVRYRGRGSFYSNNWKISFNPGEHFKSLSVIDTIRHAPALQLAAYRAFQLCGQSNLESYLIRFIENGAKDSALSVAFESPNGTWLDKYAMQSDGASIYKAGSCDCISQGKPDANFETITQAGYTYTDIYTPRVHELDPPADLVDFIKNLNTLSGDPLASYVQSHVNLDDWFRRWGMQALLGACDFTCQNYYLLHTGDDPRWRVLAFDFDYAWGHCPENMLTWPPLMGAVGEPRTYGTSANRLMSVVKASPVLTQQYYSILKEMLQTCWTEEVMFPLLDEVASEVGISMAAEKAYVSARRNFLLDYLLVPKPTPTITPTPAPTPTLPPIYPRYYSLDSGVGKGFPDAVITDINHDGNPEWIYVELGANGNLQCGKYQDKPPSISNRETIPLSALGGATDPGFLLKGDQNGDGKNDLMLLARSSGATTGMRLVQRDSASLGTGTASNYLKEVVTNLTGDDAESGKAFSETGTKTSLAVWYAGINESLWRRNNTDPIGTGANAWCRLEFDNAGSGCIRAVGGLGDFNGDGFTDAIRAYESCNNEVGVRFSNAALACAQGLHTLPGLDRVAFSMGPVIPRTCRISSGEIGTPLHHNILTFANASSLWITEFEAGPYGAAFAGEDGNPNTVELVATIPGGTQNSNNFTMIRIADLDGDGIHEIVAGSYDGKLSAYYRQNHNAPFGSGTWRSIDLLASFSRISDSPIMGLSVGNLDQDERVEILVSNDFPYATANTTRTANIIIIDGLETIPFSGGAAFMESTPIPTSTPTKTFTPTVTPTATPTDLPASLERWELY